MKIGITIGDINGVGYEVLCKALRKIDRITYEHTIELIVPNSVIQTLNQAYNYTLQLPEAVKIASISCPANFENKNIEFGKVSKIVGKFAEQSIQHAVQGAISGKYDAIVTLPVCKEAIHLTHPDFVGHTELLEKICKEEKKRCNALMVLYAGDFRIALATTHIPIHSVSKRLTKKRLKNTIHNFHKALKKDFAIQSPKLAVLGLNPHNGDNGMFGKEERSVIAPAIEIARRKGIDVKGPFAADGFFAHVNTAERKQYNGIIAMYHDQGLLPLKIFDNGEGVNFTAGLPFIRTSPDHGTCFALAGRGVADESSTIAAILEAIKLYENRKHYSKKS